MSGPAGYFDVGPQEAFREGQPRVVLVENVRVAVFRLPDGWYALKDACPHMGSSLAQGRVHDGRVTCRWHDWSFDLGSGESDSKRKACARVYDLRLENGRVWLKPPPPPGAPMPADGDDEAWMRADPDTWFRDKK